MLVAVGGGSFYCAGGPKPGTNQAALWAQEQVWQTLQIAMPIFQYAFPGCQALFAFDNASNHRYFAPDALLASKIFLNPGGKQPRKREGFDHGRGLPQAVMCSGSRPSFTVRGKPKGAEAILRERGLWPHNS